MNIFVLNEDPVIAAQEQCNTHVNKMLIESAQMLSTAHRLLDGELTFIPVLDEDGNQVYLKSGKPKMKKHWQLPDEREDVMYKAVHTGHRCVLWTMASICNYIWHYKHFVALCDEYMYRFGRRHLTDIRLRDVLRVPPESIPKVERTPFELAMGSNPECMLECPVESYRAFYQTKQDRFSMIWTVRPVPEWFEVKSERESA